MKKKIFAVILFTALILAEIGLIQAVVIESYINVQIADFKISAITLASNEEATLTVTLKNKSIFSGIATIRIKIPTEIAYTCTVTGEDSLYFEAEQEKTIDLKVKNVGNLNENITSALTLNVENQESRITDSVNIPMGFSTATFKITLEPKGVTPTPTVQPTPEPTDNGVHWAIPLSILTAAAIITVVAVVLWKKR